MGWLDIFIWTGVMLVVMVVGYVMGYRAGRLNALLEATRYLGLQAREQREYKPPV